MGLWSEAKDLVRDRSPHEAKLNNFKFQIECIQVEYSNNIWCHQQQVIFQWWDIHEISLSIGNIHLKLLIFDQVAGNIYICLAITPHWTKNSWKPGMSSLHDFFLSQEVHAHWRMSTLLFTNNSQQTIRSQVLTNPVFEVFVVCVCVNLGSFRVCSLADDSSS